MTVSTTTSRADYTGNGATTAFAVPFYFLEDTHLTVLRTQISTGAIATLAITTDYTVTGAGVPAGGTVTCVVAPTADQKISILRNVPLTQLNTYVPNDPFPAASHERALDKLTMEVQQLDEAQDRALTLPANTPAGTVSAELPTPQANKFIAWNSSANGFQNLDASSLASVTAFANAFSDTFSGNGVQTAFALSAHPGSLANLRVSISGVVQRPTIDYTWVGGTTLTFTSPPAAGTNNILVQYATAAPGVLGFGSMASQEANNVAITGGTLTGVTNFRVAATATTQNADPTSGFFANFDGKTSSLTTLTQSEVLTGAESGGIRAAKVVWHQDSDATNYSSTSYRVISDGLRVGAFGPNDGAGTYSADYKDHHGISAVAVSRTEWAPRGVAALAGDAVQFGTGVCLAVEVTASNPASAPNQSGQIAGMLINISGKKAAEGTGKTADGLLISNLGKRATSGARWISAGTDGDSGTYKYWLDATAASVETAAVVMPLSASGRAGTTILYDTNDSSFFDRAGNAFVWEIAGVNRMQMDASTLFWSANDGAALGYPTLSWSDLFLASGGVINWNNGNATLTHTNGAPGLLASSVPFQASSTDNQIRATNGTNTVSLRANATGAEVYTQQNVPMVFYTNNAEGMRIAADGNVGVGGAPGTAAFRVARSADVVMLCESTSTGAASFRMYGSTSGLAAFNNFGSWYGSTTGWSIGGNGVADAIVFRTGGASIAEAMRIDANRNVLVTGSGGLGYGTGSGGTVTQATSRTTGVTLNKTNGSITLVSAAGTATWQSFTVTNSTVAVSDTVIVSQRSGTDLYQIFVTNVAAGSFRISFATTGGTTTEQPVFNFAVIKAVTA